MATASKTPWVGALLLLVVLLAPQGARAAAPPFEIRALLVERQFDRLERLLGEAQARFESGAGSDDELNALYEAFATTDPSLEAPLDDWNKTYPESAVAPLARAHYDWHRGWVARGSGTRRNTPASRFALMRELFDQAQLDSVTALKRNGKQSLAYRVLISIGNARSAGWVEKVMLRGLEETPRSYKIRAAYLHGLTPWWGGSMAEIRAFLKDHVRSAPNQDRMLALYGYPDYVAGRLLRRKGLKEEALVSFGRAIEYGDQILYLESRSGIYIFLKRYDEALADLDRVLELSPYDADTLDDRAHLLYWRKKGKAAAHADWQLSIRLDPLDPSNLYKRSRVFYWEKRFDEAMADLDAALVYGQADHRIHGLRGKILVYELQQYRRGAEALKQATELRPDDADYWYNYAYALDKLLDCDIVPALRRYLALCAAGAACGQEFIDYAANKIKVLHEHDECLEK